MRPEVQHTTDFDRIAALPRRTLTQESAETWAAVWTEELRARGGTRAFRAWQGQAITECVENRGGLLCLPVGIGKTDLTWVLPIAMGWTRSMLIVPASLREKTYADFGSFLGQWKQPNPPPRIVSREELALAQNACAQCERGEKHDVCTDLISRHAPDGLMIDEADDMANPDSAASRRIDRYILRVQDGVEIVCGTGTPGRKSIMNYWHLLLWCLRDRAPVPMKKGEAKMWAGALDFHTRTGVRRPRPGPLGETLEQAREWYQKRLAETPGVLIVDGDSAGDVPLKIRVRVAKEDAKLDGHFARFLELQENPAGVPVSDPLSRWQMGGMLGCGLYTEWFPPPPDEWREARRALAKFTRDAITASTYTRRPLDTEGQVIKRHADHLIVQNWLAVKDKFDPIKSRRSVWLTTSAVETAIAWIAESSTPGVIWSGVVEFGEAVAAAARLSYYGDEGKDQNGRGLHAAPHGQSMVASWHANKKGFNLQPWRRFAVFRPPQSAKWLEQLIGRHHRQGQTQLVTGDIFATSGGTLDAFEVAIGEAGFTRRTIGLTQKILRADMSYEEPPRTATNEFRWARQDEKDEVRALRADMPHETPRVNTSFRWKIAKG